EAKLDQIGRDVNALLDSQGRTATMVNAFQDSVLRQHIEADLTRDPTTDRVGLFETPQSIGGYLELAMKIVSDVMAKRQAAGLNMSKAMTSYQRAQAE